MALTTSPTIPDADDEGQLDRPANHGDVAPSGSRSRRGECRSTVIRVDQQSGALGPTPTSADAAETGRRRRSRPKIPKPATNARRKRSLEPAIVAGAAGDGVSRLLVTTTTRVEARCRHRSAQHCRATNACPRAGDKAGNCRMAALAPLETGGYDGSTAWSGNAAAMARRRPAPPTGAE